MVKNNPAVNFFPEGSKRVVLNGPRPSPLRVVNKDSHFIQKPSSATKLQLEYPSLNDQPARKKPVIIYMHSPKIIHTKPKDFMALVQKLTGFTRSDDRIVRNEFHRDDHDPAILSTSFEEKESSKKMSTCSASCSSIHEHEDNDSSSVTSSDHHEEEDKYESGGIAFEVSVPVNKASYLTDFPLFTPNSNTTLFTSPHQPTLRYPDDHMVFASPNVAGSLSPSFVEFMKGFLAEY